MHRVISCPFCDLSLDTLWAVQESTELGFLGIIYLILSMKCPGCGKLFVYKDLKNLDIVKQEGR